MIHHILSGALSSGPLSERAVEAGVQWLVKSVACVHSKDTLRRQLRGVLGSRQFWVALSRHSRLFDALVAGCQTKLSQLGEGLELMFASARFQSKFRSNLAGFAPDIRDDCSGANSLVRQDRFVRLPAPVAVGLVAAQHAVGRSGWVPIWSSAADLVACRDAEVTSIHVLRLIAVALREQFKRRVSAVLQQTIDCNVKSFDQMFVHE